MAIKNNARLRVVSVENLSLELPMYDMTTGTGDFIANGVVSHNCFARRTHEYLDLDTGINFDSKIVVKVNAPELLRKELASPHWAGNPIAMGTNVDPYQRVEGRYRLMPSILETLRDARNPFSILTKGTLVLRDLDLLRQAAEVTDVSVNVSVGFVDKALWRQVEPGTPAPRARLGVCRALTDAGIGCGVLMAPILPHLTDSPRQLEATVSAIAEAGARSIAARVAELSRRYGIGAATSGATRQDPSGALRRGRSLPRLLLHPSHRNGRSSSPCCEIGDGRDNGVQARIASAVFARSSSKDRGAVPRDAHPPCWRAAR
jgi:hypothetical protein